MNKGSHPHVFLARLPQFNRPFQLETETVIWLINIQRRHRILLKIVQAFQKRLSTSQISSGLSMKTNLIGTTLGIPDSDAVANGKHSDWRIASIMTSVSLPLFISDPFEERMEKTAPMTNHNGPSLSPITDRQK
jgi:hypothetical protein